MKATNLLLFSLLGIIATGCGTGTEHRQNFYQDPAPSYTNGTPTNGTMTTNGMTTNGYTQTNAYAPGGPGSVGSHQ